MPLSPDTETTNVVALEHAIQHDIEDIADLDEFLEGDTEEYTHAMLGNAGCFY